MSPLRARMIEAMTLAGLAPGTQKTNARAVRRLAAHYRRSPDQLTEEEVRGYLLARRQAMAPWPGVAAACLGTPRRSKVDPIGWTGIGVT